MAYPMKPDSWWKKLGFAKIPTFAISTGKEIVYRVGGGPKNLPLGGFYSPLKASCVSEAERRANIVFWGNRCFYVGTYSVRPAVPMWVGEVEHDRVTPRSGPEATSQIYFEHPHSSLVLLRDIEPLRQDLFASPRLGHA
jgi:hypothetical protein